MKIYLWSQPISSRQPAYAAWLSYGRQLEDTGRTRISQHWTDDDVTFNLLGTGKKMSFL